MMLDLGTCSFLTRRARGNVTEIVSCCVCMSIRSESRMVQQRRSISSDHPSKQPRGPIIALNTRRLFEL